MTEPTSTNGAPAAGRKPWVKWVVLGCVGVLVLGGAFAALLFYVVKAATAGPEKVVEEFLAAAGRGDYDAAHAYFSAPLQQAQPLEQFRSAAEANSMFFQIAERSFTQRSIDQSGAEFSGTVTLQAGTEVPASFKLVRENGDWKLIAYQIGSGGS
jgi:hypothetical protein